MIPPIHESNAWETAMTNTLALLLGLTVTVPGPAALQSPAPQKVEVVSTIGCLKQQNGNEWTLLNATDPAPSRAGTPTPDQVPKEPAVGKNQFRLIGVTEFNLNDK